jgi:hypothetical protein
MLCSASFTDRIVRTTPVTPSAIRRLNGNSKPKPGRSFA